MSIDEKNSHQNITMTLIQTLCPNNIAIHASWSSVPVFKKSATKPKSNLDALLMEQLLALGI